MSAWAAAAGNKIDGSVTNFGTGVQVAAEDAKKATMAVAGTATGNSNTPDATMTVKAARTLINIMDVGMV